MLTRLLIFLCFFNFISSQSYSQNYKKATKFYKEGNALYSIGDFDSAIDLFLKSLIKRFKEKNKNFLKKSDIYYRLKRLIDENEMGNLFKVMLIKNKKS